MSLINPDNFKKSSNDRKKEKSGVTLVSYFKNKKPAVLIELINTINQFLSLKLDSLYESYPIQQVHATMFGLEGVKNADSQIMNLNCRKRFDNNPLKTPVMKISDFFNYFRSSFTEFQIKFGGYPPLTMNPFYRNTTPYERTFDIRSDGLAVLMGWPFMCNENSFSPRLVEFRKDMEKFGIVHKYHINQTDIDNDLFIVIGSLNYDKWLETLNGSQHENLFSQLEEIISQIRLHLLLHPCIIDLTINDLSIVKYRKSTLGEIDFCRHILQVTEREFYNLY